MKFAALLSILILTSPLRAADPAPPTQNPVEAIREKAKGQKCLNNIRQLHVALVAWQLAHNDRYPDSLEALEGDIIKNLAEVTKCPFDPAGKADGYELMLPGKLATSIPDNTILVRAKFADATGLRSVVYVNGQVTRVKDEAKK